MISRNSVHWENHHLEVKFHARLAICLTSTALTPPKDSDKLSKSRLVITETRSLPGSPCSCRVGKTTLQRLGMNGIAFYRRTSAVSTPVKYARDTPFSTVKVAAMQRVFFAASDRAPTQLRVVRNRHFKTYDSILLIYWLIL